MCLVKIFQCTRAKVFARGASQIITQRTAESRDWAEALLRACVSCNWKGCDCGGIYFSDWAHTSLFRQPHSQTELKKTYLGADTVCSGGVFLLWNPFSSTAQNKWTRGRHSFKRDINLVAETRRHFYLFYSLKANSDNKWQQQSGHIEFFLTWCLLLVFIQ